MGGRVAEEFIYGTDKVTTGKDFLPILSLHPVSTKCNSILI